MSLKTILVMKFLSVIDERFVVSARLWCLGLRLNLRLYNQVVNCVERGICRVKWEIHVEAFMLCYFNTGDVKYCDQRVCLYVCLYLSAHISQSLHVQTLWNFLYMLPWLWLGPPLTTMQYVMYFRFCGWRNGAYGTESIRQINQTKLCLVEFARCSTSRRPRQTHRRRSLLSPFVLFRVAMYQNKWH